MFNILNTYPLKREVVIVARKAVRYSTLDGLRGVGALWVMLLHFAPLFGITAPAHGYLAVDLFFCLSGFVLTRSYSRRIAKGMNFGEWMGVRLIRLYPLFFLSIILGALATSVNGVPGSRLDPLSRLAAIGTGLLMLPSPTWNAMPEIFPLNFVAWSLLVEMLLSVSFFWTSRSTTGTIWTLLGAGLVGLVMVRFLSGYIGGGFAWRDAPSGLVRGLFSFSAGMLIARYQLSSRFVSWLAGLPLLAAALMMSVNPPHGVAYDLAAIIIIIPAITFCAVHVEPRHPAAFGLFGDLSYPVYALHSVTFFMLGAITGISALHPAPMVSASFVFALFLGLCWLLDRYYDRPIRARFSAWLRERVGRSAAP